MGSQATEQKQHLLTVMLEDYFHVAAFKGLIDPRQWYRFETRFEQNTMKVLDLLDRFQIKATFFVLGWVADKQPEIVREVARRGHELGSRGLYDRDIHGLTPAEFRDDLARSRDALERACGARVLGYRAARRWTRPSDLWALDILAEEGYAYDSSLVPISRSFRREPWRRFAHQHNAEGKSIWEFPVSTCNLLGWGMPIAGGNYSRQLPHTLLKHLVERWHKSCDAPFVMYTHVWEFDPEQPRISGASPLNKIRHYRNLDKMAWVLEDYFKKYRFVGIADYLGLSRQPLDDADAVESAKPVEIGTTHERRKPLPAPTSQAVTTAEVKDAGGAPALNRLPVSIVIPCFNEELILPYLSNTLKSVEAALAEDYELRFIFVDDSSTDATPQSLKQLFGSWPNAVIVRHTRNLGVAAAILNGIRHAETEIVCSIDCDCTYDPHELRNMIPLLTEGVDMVTASPYHPQGGVRNVPGWRLSLSKGASMLYRRVLRQKLYTYTSCFRVYRRSTLAGLRLKQTGFLGVAETLGRLDLGGAKIVEHPATLEVRLFGRSKMKVLRTINGHLSLLVRLLALRLNSRRSNQEAQPDTVEHLMPEASLRGHYHIPPHIPHK